MHLAEFRAQVLTFQPELRQLCLKYNIKSNKRKNISEMNRRSHKNPNLSSNFNEFMQVRNINSRFSGTGGSKIPPSFLPEAN
jgi:hypothetical protein